MNTATITIEQLAEKLNEKVWSKGDLKRIYLDAGYNTKKMSTKTFIWQDETGEFKVSCHIECASQPYQWIQSQEDEVKDGIYQRIENALSDTVYILTDNAGKVVGYDGNECGLDKCQSFLTEESAKKEIDNCTYYNSFITMPRDEFDAEVERLEEIEKNLSMKTKIERGDKIMFYAGNIDALTNKIEAEGISDMLTATIHRDMSGSFFLRKEGDKTAFEIINEMKQPKEVNAIPVASNVDTRVGNKVKHGRFGIGTVLSENDVTIEISFDSGVKKLVKQFASLQPAE